MKFDLNLPKDRISLNNLIRYYDSVNPVVNNVLSFHSFYPINFFTIEAFDRTNSCLKYLQKLQLVELKLEDKYYKAGSNLLTLSREFWRIGEVFPYVSNENLTIFNPDAIFLKRQVAENSISIVLRPDPVLKKLANSSNPADIELQKKMPDLIKSIKENDCVPLDKDGISSIINLQNPYDLRGTSIVSAVLKDLLLFENLKENLLPTEECINNIYKGLLFSKETLPILINKYHMFRKRIERWLKDILSKAYPPPESIIISWPEIDQEELAGYLK